MKSHTLLLCSILCSTIISTSSRAQAVNTTDSLALVDLYNSTNGSAWHFHDNWLTGRVRTWYGIKVTGSRVTEINLGGENMNGSIPSSIGDLDALTRLYIDQNPGLSGSIPSSIGNLVNLIQLFLDRNQLTGNIPSSVGNLVNLRYLYLYNNQLTGNIPSSIGDLVNLKYLYLYNNQLTGNIPVSMSNCKQLRRCYLSHNRLRGSIPASFHKLVNLISLSIDHNQLSQEVNFHYPHFQRNNIYIDFSHNHSNFNGLEFTGSSARLTYSPQAPIPVHINGNTLSVSAGGTLSNNTYKWFKKGTTGSVTKTGDSTFQPAESGMYYANITNSIATKLTLTTDTVNYTMPASTAINSFYADDMKVNDIADRLVVFPNPAKEIVHVKTTGNSLITISNADGKIMLTKNINNKGAIDVTSLPNGIYYLQNKVTGEVQKIEVMH
jgi:hypothetical protein